MIFYLCQTPDGPKLAPTQADAKALDRKFKQVDVPTDKANLLSYVNDLFAKAQGAAPASGSSITVDANEFISEDDPKPVKRGANNDTIVGQFVTQGEVDKVNSQRGPCGPLTAAQIEDMRHRMGNCPKCGTNPATRCSSELMAVEEFVEKADETYLTHVEVACKMRREDIESEAKRQAEAAKTLPVARVRQRARAAG